MTRVCTQGRASVSILMVAAAALFVAACSSDDSPKADASVDPQGPDGAPGAIDGGTEADADLGDWKVLNEGSWTIPVSDPSAPNYHDPYYCIITTLHEDTYIKAFKGLIPTGTHHTVLTVYDGSEPDGVVACDAGTNGPKMIYGTGIGTPEFHYPAGVGLKLPAGTRLINNLHLFNSGDTPISGTSGTLYLPAQASEIQHEAQIVLAGPLSLTIPNGVTTVQTGTCAINNITSEPIQVFSISPHMHRLGTHMKSVLVRGGQETVIQDTDYNFESQTFTLKDPFIELRPGDSIRTECTYKNNTGAVVHWGDSSMNEMCFTDLSFFPAQNRRFFICPG
jgi:hypothetical protein